MTVFKSGKAGTFSFITSPDHHKNPTTPIEEEQATKQIDASFLNV
jgi:hypothetical protein